MQIDTNKLQEELERLKQEAWGELVATKFRESTEDELHVMRALWFHGFTKGAEAGLTMLEQLKENATRSV